MLELEDVTAGMTRPCVIDLKICDLGKTEAERAIIRKKYKGTTLIECGGFLVTGMQYFHNEVQVFHTKYEVYLLDVEQTRERLKKFFRSERLRSPVIDLMIEKIREVVLSLMNTPDYRFYSSSLLLAYDASNYSLAKAKLIDFGRTERIEGSGVDAESLGSLNSFIDFIDQLA
eukprot:CAMPEP_0204902418 /NCGR_PEP_ID=MMETSP1397-20131031/3655_1 /ASSEMBLY_ACC=CAM_ASM_000891 /TAXON_ID=49980 /ORGANISM="Climacostomum Climacostomum virens, Strain Stock W-24" /LENGTH=172 /DNA_ID=CAMNT_0052070921 /DNA_START=717 /DNA_END=1235 /DNA_ORIENTATION=-